MKETYIRVPGVVAYSCHPATWRRGRFDLGVVRWIMAIRRPHLAWYEYGKLEGASADPVD